MIPSYENGEVALSHTAAIDLSPHPPAIASMGGKNTTISNASSVSSPPHTSSHLALIPSSQDSLGARASLQSSSDSFLQEDVAALKNQVKALASNFAIYDQKLNHAYIDFAAVTARPDPAPVISRLSTSLALTQRINTLDNITVTNGLTLSSGGLSVSNGSITLSNGGITTPSLTVTGAITSSAATSSLTNLTVSGNAYLATDSTAKVGIGTSTPGTKFDVNAGSAAVNTAAFAAYGTVSGGSSVFAKYANLDTSGRTLITLAETVSDTATPFYIQRFGSTHSSNPNLVQIANANSASLAFLTSNTERVRIDSSGNVGIGTTSPAAKLSIALNGAVASTTLPNAASTAFYLSGINLAYGSSSTTTIPQAVNAWSIATSSDIGSLPLLSIDSTNGRVGISTSTPASTFTVVGSACFSKGTGATSPCSTTAGTISYNVANVNPVDVAENYPVNDQSIEPADIVALDPSTPLVIQKAKKGGNTPILGIVSTEPGMVLGYQGDNVASSTRPIALVGRVPVKISLENGPIKIGDRISVSSVAGMGMKASSTLPTVGIALESFNGTTLNADGSREVTDHGSILVFVNLSASRLDDGLGQLTHAGGPTNAWAVDQTSGKVNVIYYGDINVNGNTLLNVAKIVSANGTFSIDENGNLVVKKLTADEIETNALKIGSPTKPAGVTVYDKKGKAGCIVVQDVDAGSMQLVAGACGSETISRVSSSSSVAPSDSDSSSTSTSSDASSTATSTTASTSDQSASSSTATTTPVTLSDSATSTATSTSP